MKHIIKYLLVFLFALPLISFGQKNEKQIKIHWNGIQENFVEGGKIQTLHFTDAVNDDAFGMLPVYMQMVELDTPGLTYQFEISGAVYVPFDDQTSIGQLPDIEIVNHDLQQNIQNASIRGDVFSVLKLLPLRINEQSGLYEKLTTFNVQLIPEIDHTPSYKNKLTWAANSVLASGDWYMISVQENGIYKLTYTELKEMGMAVDNINPQNLKVFGNGGGILPEANDEFVYDDLHENAIVVEAGNDGSFDEEDYMLFYGESPVQWVYEPSKLAFKHIGHPYSDYTYYFITAGEGAGKRIQNLEPPVHPASEKYTTFNDYAYHEINEQNLIRSGATWYGETFDEVLTYHFPFEFPNIDTDYQNYFVADVAGKSPQLSQLTFHINEDSLTTIKIPAIPPQSVIIYANALNKNKRFQASSDLIDVMVQYNKPAESSKAWLNYIELNAMRHLIYEGGQLLFRNVYTIGEGRVSEFELSSTPADFSVWDITNPLEPKAIIPDPSVVTYNFSVETDTLREFVGFTNDNFLTAMPLGKIENQNLHALQNHDLIIVSHPDFLDQANRLKDLHEELDGMQVCVVSPQQIFNEFSSGAQDPSAIRNFVKMIYERGGSPSQLKYLLLFGDGSYDPKDRIDGNKNFVMTYQSKQSLKLTSSYVTDDFFGLMDPNEGEDANGNVDVGIGRLPANTPEEAESMVDKIENYMRYSEQTQGSWKNKMCFVADDEDYNLHFYQADTVLSAMVARRNQTINQNKIYLDAFQQVSTSGGSRYPEANIALNQQVEEGALFVNYTGHGGELGWCAENVLQISDINSWTNFNKLPVFITATCEFSRFDNPSLSSAGELVLLNPDGGGIALLTTTRLAFAQSNLTLNKRIYDTLFRAEPDNYPRLGDLIRFSKTPSNSNIRNFVLLGDPALKLAFPKYDVLTETINGVPVEVFADTLKANSTLTVNGYIADFTDEQTIIENFNGTLYPVLYDKVVTLTTLGNDPKSSPAQFEMQDRILYQGKASVTDGKFSFSFVIPKDISYQYGNGKLSYYAADSLADAGGHYNEFILGGYDENALSDDIGPEIELFLNDSLFVSGSNIYPNPVMYARLEDEGGINTSGTGIGHDIVATLDGTSNSSIVLNNFFEPDLDDFTSGKITFPFYDLPKGKHTLELKAWDMYNNSSSTTIEFYVSDSLGVELTQVMNFPNPFDTDTYFSFRHNQFGEDLTVMIEIYNFSGKLVTTLNPQIVITNGYTVDPIFWDGTDDGGSKLEPGFYFYKMIVGNDLGNQSQVIQKMVISN